MASLSDLLKSARCIKACHDIVVIREFTRYDRRCMLFEFILYEEKRKKKQENIEQRKNAVINDIERDRRGTPLKISVLYR